MSEKKSQRVNIFWFRRDLRLQDNRGLYQALSGGLPVLPVFIFDSNILDKLDQKNDARVAFIHQQLQRINEVLHTNGSSLLVLHGTPLEAFQEFIQSYEVSTVYCNHDYEPYAIARDKTVARWLSDLGVDFKSFKDQVIFEKNEITKSDGKPYSVFTPYMKQWKLKYSQEKNSCQPLTNSMEGFFITPASNVPSLKSIGFSNEVRLDFPTSKLDLSIVRTYHLTRDYPAIAGTTRMGIHLRFGTLSIRQLVNSALESNEIFLQELIWREFYMMILWHFPHVVERAFKPAYDHIPWRNNEQEFTLWCKGKTGFPLVDAGMRELNETGYMHNRVRMVTASFLSKHLLVDWRWGEAYFGEKLLDYELASNNGGWQWAAGTGCDAAPYFRIFNPALQAKKFDPHLEYINRWVPELNLPDYPDPMVEHAFARNRALETYKSALAATINLSKRS